MMANENKWINVALLNLSLTALLGFILRTKYLYSFLTFLEYRNILSAHSHFAFGGWVTLMLFILLIKMLPAERQQNYIYQMLLTGIQVTATGMVLTFPFQGYGALSIFFSTVFIFFTWIFAGIYIKDILKAGKSYSVKLLSISALIFLVISSAGPFTLAYMLASESGDATLYRDSLYGYLHFNYNGFFTLTVFAVMFDQLKNVSDQLNMKIRRFVLPLVLAVPPGLFLALTWHSHNVAIQVIAAVGCLTIFVSIVWFIDAMLEVKKVLVFKSQWAKMLWLFAMFSFLIKSVLQMGTIVPQLATAVFGFRPIIIGFLHLVFLGFVTFYILSYWIEYGYFSVRHSGVKAALLVFSSAIIINELILLVQGIGLMLNNANPVYAVLLWYAAILLFSGAALLVITGLLYNRSEKEKIRIGLEAN